MLPFAVTTPASGFVAVPVMTAPDGIPLVASKAMPIVDRGTLSMVKLALSLRKRKLFVAPSTNPATVSTLLALPRVTDPPAITPRERDGGVEGGEVGTSLVIGPPLFWLTEPPVTSRRLGTLVVSMVIGLSIFMLPFREGVPFVLRYPICNIPAVMLSRSDCPRSKPIRMSDGPSTIVSDAVTGPSTTVPAAPTVEALIVPVLKFMKSARTTMFPAAAGEVEVLSTTELLKNAPLFPPAIKVIGPPEDEIGVSTVRLNPLVVVPVVATVRAPPAVATPESALANG